MIPFRELRLELRNYDSLSRAWTLGPKFWGMHQSLGLRGKNYKLKKTIVIQARTVLLLAITIVILARITEIEVSQNKGTPI